MVANMKKDNGRNKFDKCSDKSNVKKYEHFPALGLKKVEGSDIESGKPCDIIAFMDSRKKKELQCTPINMN